MLVEPGKRGARCQVPEVELPGASNSITPGEVPSCLP
jgi:hypothetical protein